MSTTLDKIRESAKDLNSKDVLKRSRAQEIKRRYEAGMFNDALKAEGAKPVPLKQPPRPRVNLQEALAGQKKGLQSALPTGDTRREDIGTDLQEGLTELRQVVPERGAKSAERMKQMADPKTFGQGGFGVLAQGLGAFLDAGLIAAKTTAKAFLTPEQEDQWRRGLEKTLQNPSVQSLGEAIAGAHEIVTKDNPEIATALEDAGILAEFAIGTSKPVLEGIETTVEASKRAGKEAIETGADVGKKALDFGVEQAEGLQSRVGTILAKRAEKKAEKNTNKKISAALESTSGVLTKKEREAAIKAGNTEIVDGVIKPKPTERDIERAEVVAEFIEPNFIKSRDNISTEIARIAKEDIRPALQAKPSPFNGAQFKKQLTDIQIPKSFKTDPVLERTYESVRQTMIDVLADHPNTMEGLYDARIAFDKLLVDEFGDSAFTTRSTVKRAARDVRSKVNDFINETVGDDILKDSLRKQHLMFEAIENIAEQNQKLFGTTKYQRWAKENPKKDKALRFGSASLIGAGAASLVF